MFPVEVFQHTLAKLTRILTDQQIRFHLTGGLTGVAYGEPRMTQDVDVVIDPQQTQQQVDEVVRCFHESDFMFDESTTRRAIDEGGMFQLLDTKASLKLDVYPRELILGELDRSVSLEIFEGEFLPVVSRVDAAGSKLVWISKGSHKSRRDLRAVYTRSSVAEQEAITTLADELGLLGLLNEVLNEPDEIR